MEKINAVEIANTFDMKAHIDGLATIPANLPKEVAAEAYDNRARANLSAYVAGIAALGLTKEQVKAVCIVTFTFIQQTVRGCQVSYQKATLYGDDFSQAVRDRLAGKSTETNAKRAAALDVDALTPEQKQALLAKLQA